MIEHPTTGHVDAAFCATRARHGASRSRLAELVRTSMRGLTLDAAQVSALEVLRDPSSVVAVTGQQIGLFGGPMYTLAKIRTAVEEARRVTTLTGCKAVPVFWLEDNDHDAAEATSAHLLSSEGHVVDVLTWDGTDERRSVAERTISADMRERIIEASALLTGQHADGVRERTSQIYAEGRSLADAFLDILQPYLGPWGVLVVRGSAIVAAGLHRPILMKDMDPPGALAAVIAATTATLEASGTPAQATVGPFVFFGSDANGRAKLASGTNHAAEAAATPEHFTPTVLARPIVQDAVLPSVISVLGAAELAYHAQLPDAYAACGVPMPVLVRRNGLTIVDARTERLLIKSGHDAAWFQRTSDELERALADELTADVIPAAETTAQAIDALLAPYLAAAEKIDVTLVGTVRAQGAGITSTMEALTGKMRAAAKKANAAVADRARSIHTILYPNGVLQERIFPLAFWEARLGIDTLRIIVDRMAEYPIGTHRVVAVSEINSQE